jgi:PilZ domain
MPEQPYRDLGRGRRKSQRREFEYSVKLVAPDQTRWNGFIIDISDSGAQLEVLNPQELPDEFSMLIGGQSAVQRVCRVVWRSETRLGVRFIRQPDRVPTTPTGAFWAQRARKPRA